MKKYYEILNLNPDCSYSDIKNSYYNLCKIYHPDKNNGDDDMFKEIKEAYDILSDAERRADYDFELSDGCIPKNINIKHTINISLKDCYFGCCRKVKINGQTYDINIPEHTKPGDSVILKGQGWNGGDLELEISVPKDDDLWVDEKYNLHCVKEVDIWDGILGCDTCVDVFGNTVNFTVKPNTYNNMTMVIIGKGYPIGDRHTPLVIEVKIIHPKSLSEEQIEHIKKIRELNGVS